MRDQLLAVNPMPPPVIPRPVPEDVRTAGLLWYLALAVGVVQAVGSLIASIGQRRDLAQQMFDQVQGQQPVTLAQVQVWVMVLLVLVAVFWLVLSGIAVAFVYQLARGKSWARSILTGFAVFLLLGAAGTLIGSGAKPGAAAVVAGCAGIVQAVLAGGAVFLCYRKESELFFRPGPR
ncbi:hypothetical protein [Nocardia sp. NBC_01388]|uniref:hypothetical protein n=1 Tax=Nocardia sp. NBC_01388 TaxID=2903596 RepID=UPI00324D140F